ncbi:T9SS type A sorting domain-containing protein [Dysgonomonas capnocytophagoides]|uniref:T9SS type A sorting domain-containing protein n=1 Tax=Dysgonomonas capnocytophagoides TaxID=45254 RepID=UPI00333F2DD2
MKLLNQCYLLLFLLYPNLLLGQINIQYNGLRSGDTIIKQQVEFKDPGREGENVIWDFGKLKSINNRYSLTYSSPDLLENSYYILGRDTIQANNDSVRYLIGTEHSTMYYYQLKNNQIVVLGHENPTTSLTYTEPMLVYSYPMNFLDSCQSSYESKGIYSAKVPFTTSGAVDIKSDAYGVIVLPSGDTINHVIRLKTIQTLKENVFDVNNLQDVQFNMIIETYKWYSKGYRYPIFESIRTINNKDSLTLSEFQTAFFFPPQEHLYLDTDPDNLAVLDSLWNIDHKIPDVTDPTQEQPNANLSYNFYPNPVESMLTVEYYLEKPSSVTISLYNLEGRLIKTIVKPISSSGIYTEQINCSSLAKGTYIISIGTGYKVYSDKIIKR